MHKKQCREVSFLCSCESVTRKKRKVMKIERNENRKVVRSKNSVGASQPVKININIKWYDSPSITQTCNHAGVSLVAHMVKNPLAMRETQFQSLCWEDPLKKGMATHSSILAWRIPWTEVPGGLQSTGSQRVRHD